MLTLTRRLSPDMVPIVVGLPREGAVLPPFFYPAGVDAAHRAVPALKAMGNAFEIPSHPQLVDDYSIVHFGFGVATRRNQSMLH